jgi:hypothetical protein
MRRNRMKKSEIYTVAMCSVIEDRNITPIRKLEIIERLMQDKSIAKLVEEKEEEKEEEEKF